MAATVRAPETDCEPTADRKDVWPTTCGDKDVKAKMNESMEGITWEKEPITLR